MGQARVITFKGILRGATPQLWACEALPRAYTEAAELARQGELQRAATRLNQGAFACLLTFDFSGEEALFASPPPETLMAESVEVAGVHWADGQLWVRQWSAIFHLPLLESTVASWQDPSDYEGWLEANQCWGLHGGLRFGVAADSDDLEPLVYELDGAGETSLSPVLKPQHPPPSMAEGSQ